MKNKFNLVESLQSYSHFEMAMSQTLREGAWINFISKRLLHYYENSVRFSVIQMSIAYYTVH